MSKEVQAMFSSIANRYDLTNSVLSLGIHHLWRGAAVRESGAAPGKAALDVCTGTGDLALMLARAVGTNGQVIAIDFVPEMLTLAGRKQRSNGSASSPVQFIRGDALRLPVADGLFDLATIAFGIRNVDDPIAGLHELKRTLKPNGRLVVLEFGAPTSSLFGTIYRLYSKWVMPRIGGLLTGNRSAYEYLPRTAIAFPTGPEFLRLLERAGFKKCSFRPLLGGIAYLYTAAS